LKKLTNDLKTTENVSLLNSSHSKKNNANICRELSGYYFLTINYDKPLDSMEIKQFSF